MHNPLRRLLTLALLLSPIACSAQPEAFVEGQDYKEVRNVEQSDSDKIRVTEIFWYGCPHCFRFEPHIRDWHESAPEDVVFERLPTALGREAGRLQVKAFYAADALDVQPQVHAGLFQAIHDQNRRMASKDALAKLFAQAGVSPDDFEKTFDGFTIENRTRRAEKRVSDFGVASVPTVIVDGRWKVGAADAGSFEKMIEIIDFLVDKARRRR